MIRDRLAFKGPLSYDALITTLGTKDIGLVLYRAVQSGMVKVNGMEYYTDWSPEEDECLHHEHDHFICIDCGEELDPGSFIDAAMDYYENR